MSTYVTANTTTALLVGDFQHSKCGFHFELAVCLLELARRRRATKWSLGDFTVAFDRYVEAPFAADWANVK